MSNVNKVILVGRLGGDPTLRYTKNSTAVANFSVATTERWTDADGGKQEHTEWHRVVAWGRLGEICGNYLAKGRLVYVEGRLRTREWTDSDDTERRTLEIVASDVRFLSPAPETRAKRNDDIFNDYTHEKRERMREAVDDIPF